MIRSWHHPFPQLQQQRTLGRGECIQQQGMQRGIMGNGGALQQVESGWTQIGTGAPAINGAGETPHQPASLQALDGTGQPTRAEANDCRQTGHTLRTTGNCECAEQFVFPERESMLCL
jgi:hypothetical protein